MSTPQKLRPIEKLGIAFVVVLLILLAVGMGVDAAGAREAPLIVTAGDERFGVSDAPLIVEAPVATVSRVGAECYTTYSADYCARHALTQCEVQPVLCSTLDIETRPLVVGGAETGDILRGHVIPDGLLWAIALDPGFSNPEARRWAVVSAICESGGDQYSESTISSAIGWWQHLGRFLYGVSGRLAAAGFPPGTDYFEPAVQARVTALLFNNFAGASHWEESRDCWSIYL